MNDVEKEIWKLEEELTQTEMRVDVEALDRIYAEDIMVTAPIGICVDKPAVMEEVRQAAGMATIKRYDKDDLRVRSYGDDTAVTSYRLQAEATFAGTEINRRFFITNVWLKREGHWQVVARHTAQPEPPALSEAEARQTRMLNKNRPTLRSIISSIAIALASKGMAEGFRHERKR